LGVSLRPVSSLLGQNGNQYQERQEAAQDYFRELKEGKGFYIPAYFMEFIDRYYGFAISGEPISQLSEIREGVSQQCFQNYCLLFDAKADPGQQVRILPQGQKYKDSFHKQAQQPANQPEVLRDVQLDIWEQLPQISSLESQQIGACIHEAGTPLVNVPAEVHIFTQELGSMTYQFEPTDTGGCSFLVLEPIQGQNGTTVDYQVCFLGLGNQQYCQKDSYLIWGNTDSVLVSIPPATDVMSAASSPEVLLDTWELYPQISSSEGQEIGACAHGNNQPVPNLNAQLILETPNAGVLTYQSSSTDQGGCTFFKLDPINANNGETIAYQVCFTNKYGENFCNRDSFLIWGNP